jgi:hypothetical protein
MIMIENAEVGIDRSQNRPSTNPSIAKAEEEKKEAFDRAEAIYIAFNIISISMHRLRSRNPRIRP